MKTKFRLSTGGIEIKKEMAGIELTLPAFNIEGEVEYAPSEIKDLWDLTKIVTQESPEVFSQFAINLIKTYQATQQEASKLVQEEEVLDASC